MDSIAARIPTWKSGLLTHVGRVLLTKVALSAIPVHVSITCCLSQWAIGQINKRRRVFLWAGTDSTNGGKCRVSWPLVCTPTVYGGLGVIDLRLFGFALRLRWNWLIRTQPERCWTRLPSRAEKSVDAMCATSLWVIVGDGAATNLWTDNWATVGPLCKFAPELFACISRTRKKRVLRDALQQHQWARDIVGALTTQVLCQYLQVWELL